jgi:hypothetical protein
VHHCEGGLCWKITCICSPSVELKLLYQNCLYFLIHPRICLYRLYYMFYLNTFNQPT